MLLCRCSISCSRRGVVESWSRGVVHGAPNHLRPKPSFVEAAEVPHSDLRPKSSFVEAAEVPLV